jgi:hypothetical protein
LTQILGHVFVVLQVMGHVKRSCLVFAHWNSFAIIWAFAMSLP